MNYKLVFLRSAVKELKNIEIQYQIIIKQKIIRLSENFESLKNNITALKGKEELYRLKAGKYRVVFTKDDVEIVITIVRIGHRKDVYKK